VFRKTVYEGVAPLEIKIGVDDKMKLNDRETLRMKKRGCALAEP